MVAIVYQTCIGSESRSIPGLFGKTLLHTMATVEQQGRLTLHLHMLSLDSEHHYLHKKLEIELWTQILISKKE